MNVRYTVVEDHRFRAELLEIERDTRRSDEALRYLTFQLARNPEIGIRSKRAPGVWVAPINLPLAGQRGFVSVDVYYVIRGDAVHLISCRRVERD